jgi:hypothetical protein
VSMSFLVDFFRSFRYNIMPSSNRDSLISFILTCIPFLSSSCLIVSLLTLEEMVSVFPHLVWCWL